MVGRQSHNVFQSPHSLHVRFTGFRSPRMNARPPILRCFLARLTFVTLSVFPELLSPFCHTSRSPTSQPIHIKFQGSYIRLFALPRRSVGCSSSSSPHRYLTTSALDSVSSQRNLEPRIIFYPLHTSGNSLYPAVFLRFPQLVCDLPNLLSLGFSGQLNRGRPGQRGPGRLIKNAVGLA